VKILQLEEVQADRSALAAIYEQELNKAESTEKIHAITGKFEISSMAHVIDKELVLHHNHEVAVWGFSMTQYNLKPGH
jgi:hypothetical protein